MRVAQLGKKDCPRPAGCTPTQALRVHGEPAEVVTDWSPASPAAIEELMPAAFHYAGLYANNRVECDQGRLKASDRSAASNATTQHE